MLHGFDKVDTRSRKKAGAQHNAIAVEATLLQQVGEDTHAGSESASADALVVGGSGGGGGGR